MTTRIRTTRIYYEGDGSTVDFAIPFDYLAKRFVQVYVDNELQQGGTSDDRTAVYYFANPTTIRFNTAPASGTQVLIKRFTDATDRIVTFNDASVLLADDLNASQIQTIHIAEEGRDIIDDALIVNTDGNWDARNRRIVNVADPIDPQDALTYGYYFNDVEGSKAAAEEAKEAATAAAESAEAAASSAQAAAESLASAEQVLAQTEEVYQDTEEVADEVLSNLAAVSQIKTEVEGIHQEIVDLVTQIQISAAETLTAFESYKTDISSFVDQSKTEINDIVSQSKEDITEATDIVLATKDYIEGLVNSDVVQNGLACARSTWVLKENLPAGTVITMEGNPTYIVGRKHLFISYDGIVMSPTFYNEVGDFNTTSTEVSFNFDLYKGQELTAWVVTLGNSDSEIYGRITAVESTVTQAQTDITALQQADTDINEKLESLTGDGTSYAEAIAALQQADTDINSNIESLNQNDQTIAEAINQLNTVDEGLRTDVDWLKEHIGGESGEVVVKDGYKTVTVDGTELSATAPEDTLSITAGDNIKLTADLETKSFTISAEIPEPPAVPVEMVIVNSLDEVPAELKVGGLALVKEGYDE